MRFSTQTLPGSATRRLGLFFILGIALLCWPAVLNHSPLIFADSKTYYTSGGVALDKLATIIAKLWQHGAPSDAAADAMLAQARGVRSAFYSVFMYGLTRFISLWAVIIAQAALACWAIVVLHRVYRPDQPRPGLALLLGLAVLSDLPWTVSLVMPDVFAGIMVLCLACLVTGWTTLGVGTRLGLLALFTACIVMHVSNLPLAIVLIGASVPIFWRQSHTLPLSRLTAARRWARRLPWVTLSASVLIAMAAMVMVSVVAFKEWSLTPKAPPFLTARSLDDGPGRLYLQANCPQAGLAMCRHLDKLDLPPAYFVWCRQGVYSTVSPEEQAALRRDDKALAVRAALAYPWLQAEATAANMFTQLLSFSVFDLKIPSSARISGDTFTIDGVTDLKDCPDPNTPEAHDADATFNGLSSLWDWRFDASVPIYLGAFLACVMLRLLWVTHRLTRAGKQLIGLVIVGVLTNAVISGGISMPTPRYGARVMWLLPLLAGLLWRRQPVGNTQQGSSDMGQNNRVAMD
jgi:hypothetical protein